ncbi:protein root UVB sensitive 3 isoform X1 [Cinnamomum micranthum f. kanehirae]|uniref:Protein root UVB sensitive 3 isoform X1 n=1 Tax=Cinnamomum micranthum f. kanehirae TaxID=337451 RepID=A0A443PGF1_9MAGN|nr:protein root UVB sensitive 3 isoform X1 [Cinnamomum micranthum f. kanehirae]
MYSSENMASANPFQGFPSSVTPDYVTFQVWDSLQGLSTYIRCMLSTQALLSAIGVGEKSATVIGATFQWFLRDLTGMLGGVLFIFYQVLGTGFAIILLNLGQRQHGEISSGAPAGVRLMVSVRLKPSSAKPGSNTHPGCKTASRAIDGYRQQMTSELFLFGRSECEETSSDGQPVLEEFIPLKRGSSSSEKEEEEEEEEEEITNERSGKKPDWLRSVQLWNQEPDPPSNEESSRKPAAVDEMMVKKEEEVGGAFHPFHGEKNTSKAQAAATSSTAETRRPEEKDGRKARRCWSPELHRRFLQALQQLGGPHGQLDLLLLSCR